MPSARQEATPTISRLVDAGRLRGPAQNPLLSLPTAEGIRLSHAVKRSSSVREMERRNENTKQEVKPLSLSARCFFGIDLIRCL